MVIDPNLTSRQIDEQIDELLTRKEELVGFAFRPMYPWVFVRVCSKAQTTPSGLIHLPAHEQNKTVHEGIVISTWRPFQKHFSIHSKGPGSNISQHKVMDYASELKRGDRVLFPHWSGLPVVGYSEDKYRIVRENGDGSIMATVEDTAKDLHAKLLETMNQGLSMDSMARYIEDRFLLVDLDEESVTLSGR